MRSLTPAAVLVAAALLIGGCGEDSSSGTANELDAEAAEQFAAGQNVAAQSGCGACHKFGENGNDGPGPELTEIGDRLPAAAIARSLEVGPGIMPSYADLPPQKKEDLVAFLAALRGD